MGLLNKLLATFVISHVLWTVSSKDPPPEYREECLVWENVTHVLTTERNTEMTCSKNIQCTGYDCSGTYSYRGIYSAYQTLNVDFCFGMAIHPCNNPVDMHFYVEKPDDSTNDFQATISNGTKVQIPGITYKVNDMARADAFVDVTMERKMIWGKPYVKLGLVFKIRVQGLGGLVEQWPSELQRTLMPDENIPVPECNRDVVTPTHPPHMCTKFSTTKPKPTKYPPPTKKTPAKSCVKNDLQGCDHNEMCKSGICICMKDYVRNDNQCIPLHPTDPPVYPYPSGQISGKNSKHLTTIYIAVSVVVVAVIVIAIFTFFFIRFKRHQQRYGGHQMLATDEEDDDPLDVST